MTITPQEYNMNINQNGQINKENGQESRTHNDRNGLKNHKTIVAGRSKRFDKYDEFNMREVQ